MSISKLIEKKSYDIFSLACDIGGSLGLFLGASIVTLIELLDWFVLRPALEKKKQWSNISAVAAKSETSVELQDARKHNNLSSDIKKSVPVVD